MEHPALPKPSSMPRERMGRNAKIALFAVMALLSVTLLRGIFSSADTYRPIYETLDERQNNVLSLAFGSAVISSIISALPDDMGTALSSEYADFYTGFALVVCALLLEKYLLTTIGFGFFTIIVPICCALEISFLLRPAHDPGAHRSRLASRKILAFGLVLFLMTPTSVLISRQIDDTYRASIQETIESTEEATNQITAESQEKKDEDEPDNPLAFMQRQLDNASSAIGGAIDTVGTFASSIFPWAIGKLRSYAELFAVMLVTSIVIPVLVPIVVYLVFKILFLGESDVTIPASLVAALGAKPELPPTNAGTAIVPATTDAARQAADGDAHPSPEDAHHDE